MDVCKYELTELVNHVARLVQKIVEEKPDAVLCIASGETPRPVMERLVEMKRSGEIDFSQVRFIGLDEWIGVGVERVGSCAQMLYDDFFKALDVREDQIILFDGLAQDLEGELSKMNRFTDELGIDFILLGVGMNGHIGLNEPGPGTLVDEETHLVNLSEMTKVVMTKYFDDEVNLSQGITLGFGQILKAENIILMATGKRKSEIVQRVFESPVNSEIPATLLKKAEKKCLFLVDEQAGSRF